MVQIDLQMSVNAQVCLALGNNSALDSDVAAASLNYTGLVTQLLGAVELFIIIHTVQ